MIKVVNLVSVIIAPIVVGGLNLVSGIVAALLIGAFVWAIWQSKRDRTQSA